MTRPSRTDNKHHRTSVRRGAAILALSLALGVAGQLRADQPLTIDLNALTTHPAVMPSAVEGPVWRLEPREGRQLIAIAYLTAAPDAELHLDEPVPGLAFARFVAWHLPDDDPEPTTSRRRGPRQRDFDFDPGEFDRFDLDRPQPRRGRPEPEPAPAHGVPADAPRLTREITLTPDGQVHWSLDTSISGGEVREDDGRYILRLRPNRLRDLAPDRDELDVDDNLPSQQRARQLQQARAEFQQAREDFAALRDEVQNLDESFSMPAPRRIWAIYELPPTMRDLAFEADHEPLPWAMDFMDFEALRAFAGTRPRRGGGGVGGGVGGGGFAGRSPARRADVEPMSATDLRRLARSSHVYDQRVAAYAVDAAAVADNLERFTSEYRLFEDLARADDHHARRTAVASLASVSRPSDATAALLRSVADHRDPETRLAALAGLLRADEPAQHLTIAQALLADAAGPAPADVLDAVLDAVGSSRNLVDDAVDAIDFNALTPDRLREAADHVIAAAPAHELAARWLDQRMLGSERPDVVRTTLERLARIDDEPDDHHHDPHGGDSPSLLGQALGLLFNVQTDTPAFHGAPGHSPGPGFDAWPEPDFPGSDEFAFDDHMPGDRDDAPTLIRITDEHNFLRTLDDPGNAELAFQSLHRFSFDTTRGGQRFAGGRNVRGGGRRGAERGGRGGERPADRYERLVEASLARGEVPLDAVNFLARHDTDAAGAALVRLAAEGSAPAATALLGRDWNLAPAIEQLEPEQRHTLAWTVYEAAHAQAPLVTGLMRAEPEQRRQNDGARWFADQLAIGELPPAEQWVTPFGGRSRLLDLVADRDADLAAGAITALLAAAGASADDLDDRAERILQADNPASAFRSAEREIHTARLHEIAGQYRLDVLIRGRADPGLADMSPEEARRHQQAMRQMRREMERDDPRFARRQQRQDFDESIVTRRLRLGVTELMPDDQGNVKLGGDVLSLTLPADYFALRIDRLADLRNLPVPALDNLPLDDIDDPLDLLPQPDGSLRGQSPMPDGRILEIRMEPAD